MATKYPNIIPYPNLLNGGKGATSITVTSPNNTITQIGSSTIVDNNLNVELEANINALIPNYNTYDDLPDPNTLPTGSYASVKQGFSTLVNYEPAGIYQVVEFQPSTKYWNYLGTYADNYTIIYDNVLKVNTGTTANKIVQLDNNAKIPAVDASQTTVGTIVPENNPVVTNDNLNTTANKLQGQINTLLNIINSSNGLQPVMLYFDTNQTLSGLPTQGGYTCVDNDRVICTNQTNPAENLIYNVHSGAWTIASDSEKVNELLGAWTEIVKGTYNNSYTYLVSITPASGNVTPTSVTWSTPVPAGLYQAGNGLNLTGSVFSAVYETNTSNIKMDGIANIGTSNNIPRADHVHPSDTSKQNLISSAIANNIVTTNVDGQVIDSGKKFSTDVALNQNSNDNIPTEAVIKSNVDYLNNRISNLPIGAGQGVLYYLTNDANGSYLTLSTIPKNGTDDFLFTTVNNSSPRQLLGAFATALPLNKTTLDAGIWEFNIWCLADNIQETTYINVEVYTLSNTNTETLLFAIDNNQNIGSLDPIVYSLSTTENAYTILPTDKLLIKFYADTTKNQDVIVAMYYNSQNYYSHMHTPIVVSHNQLSGLNGGDGVNQYYHLTQNQYNNVINQATTTQNGYLASTDFTTFNNKQNALTNPVTSSNATPTANQLSVFNATGTQVTPTTILPTSAIPVFTNDVTSAGGSTTLTIANNAVTNAKQAQMATNTIKGNNTGATANANDLTVTQVNTMLETFNNVYYVSPNGLDTNTGKSLNTPVKTLAQALTLSTNTGDQIVVMPGIYNENTTITDQNVTITSSNRELSGIINFTGTITVNHSASSVRLSGLNINNLVHSGAGSLYADELNITTFNKTGTGYVEISSSDMQGSSNNGTISITGAGTILFVNKCNLGALTINNASAFVNLINNINSFPITLTAGTLGINNTPVYSATATSNAITIASGSTCIIANSSILTPTNTNARVNFPSGCFYSLNNVTYDQINSILTGANLNRIIYFDNLKLSNALPIASGGTGAVTQQTAINALAGGVTSGQYLRGNGTNVLLSTIQNSDLPVFVGDAGSGGTKGAVPAPVAGDATAGKFLSANGTWAQPNTLSVVFFKSQNLASASNTGQQINTNGLIPWTTLITNALKFITINNNILQVGGFTNTTNSITIPQNGYYQINFTFSCAISGIATVQDIFCQLVNTRGANSTILTLQASYGQPGNNRNIAITFLDSFLTNDVITFRIEAESTTTCFITSYSLNILKIN